MAGLNDLIRRLERMGAAEVKARIAAKVRDAMHKACVDGFNAKVDPYGNAWAPRKRSKGWAALAWPDDGHQLLDKSGKMIDSLRVVAIGTTVRLTMKFYAWYHQKGTTHAARSDIKTRKERKEYSMPARMLVPDPDKGLGTWSEPVHRAAVEAVRELMH